jgi:hypothetical protein
VKAAISTQSSGLSRAASTPSDSAKNQACSTYRHWSMNGQSNQQARSPCSHADPFFERIKPKRPILKHWPSVLRVICRLAKGFICHQLWQMAGPIFPIALVAIGILGGAHRAWEPTRRT